MKKIASLCIVFALLMGMLAGCGGGSSGTGGQQSAPESTTGEGGATAAPTAEGAREPKNGTHYVVGTVKLAIVDTPTSRASDLANEIAFGAADIEQLKIQITEYGDEAFLNAYESLCKQGVDAVICYTLSETVLPLLRDMFEEYEVRFFMANRRISDDAIRESMMASPMCVGNDYCSETDIAYELTEYLHKEHGVTNLAVIGLTKGDVNGDYRDAGIEAACEEYGITLLSETRGIVTTEDVTNAVEGFIASYPEMDGIYIVGGVITHGALAGVNQALTNHGLTDKVAVAMVDIAAGMSEYMDDGPLKIVAGGNLIPDFIFSFVALANDLYGTPLAEDSYVLNTRMMYITGSAAADDYDTFIEGTVSVYTAEEYQQLMYKWLNPDVTLESVQALASSFSAEDAKERHADLF